MVACKHLEITEQTYYRWRNQYGGMKTDDAKRLKELERENSRVKKIVADQALDIDMLKEVNRGNFSARPNAGRVLLLGSHVQLNASQQLFLGRLSGTYVPGCVFLWQRTRAMVTGAYTCC